MEPIISPWLIYLICIIGHIHTLGVVVLVSSVMALLIIFKVSMMENTYNETKKFLKAVIIVIFISLFTTIFIPTEKTVITMIVADNITYERVEKVTKGSSDIKNALKQDVIDIINGIRKEKEENGK